MSTYFDDASLVMIPSGYKDDKLYSIKPTSGDGDFTFSRDGSGASPATRVNSAGLIEKGRTNLLLQSNTFDTTWTQTDITTLTSGQSGYDGTNDSWLVEKSASSNSYLRQNISSSGVHTFSLYAKSNSLNGVLIQTRGASTKSAQFDLSTGAIGTTANNIDAKIEDVGNGWYRCSISVDDSGITQVRVFICDDGTTIGTTAGSIYIQDAQLEKGLVATSYIETTTAAASAGILGDMPRLDYSGGASCPSLLLEPARTNVVPFSEHLESSDWAKTRCTIEDNSTTSPEGVNNASKMTSTDANESYIQDNLSFTGSTIVWSFFAKKGDLDYCHGLVWDLSANGCRQWFNLNDGTVGGSTTFGSGYSVSSATIEDYGSGWYRCTMIVSGSSGSNGCRVSLSSANTTITSAVNSYGYFYGLQGEEGSYPTSYVPSYGSATARAKDFFVMNLITNGITTASQTEATLFIEFEKPNTGENVDLMRFRGTGTLGRGYIYNTAAGFASDWGQGLNFTIGENTKAVWRVNSLTDGEVFVNGTKSSNASGTAWSDIRELRFNAEGVGGVLKIKQIALFPTALTDVECTALTT